MTLFAGGYPYWLIILVQVPIISGKPRVCRILKREALHSGGRWSQMHWSGRTVPRCWERLDITIDTCRGYLQCIINKFLTIWYRFSLIHGSITLVHGGKNLMLHWLYLQSFMKTVQGYCASNNSTLYISKYWFDFLQYIANRLYQDT